MLMMKMMSPAIVRFRFRCNVLAPGLFPSELAGDMIAGLRGEDGMVDADVIPAERTGSEEDIAGAMLYTAVGLGRI